jgi:hypothetical protein
LRQLAAALGVPDGVTTVVDLTQPKHARQSGSKLPQSKLKN